MTCCHHDGSVVQVALGYAGLHVAFHRRAYFCVVVRTTCLGRARLATKRRWLQQMLGTTTSNRTCFLCNPRKTASWSRSPLMSSPLLVLYVRSLWERVEPVKSLTCCQNPHFAQTQELFTILTMNMAGVVQRPQSPTSQPPFAEVMPPMMA